MAAWINRAERTVYESPWFRLNLADVELPDGRHLDHYLLRQRPVVLTACLNAQERVLMLWRHRFIPDTYGYELPSGVVEPGEDLEAAAARETLEETGWQPGPLKHLLTVEPSAGFSDAVHHAYYAESAEYVGDPADAIESDRIEWVPLADIPELISQGKIRAANTVATLLILVSSGR
ncbi:NUDIX hydrolase [Actinospica robiniae]|uniref:NUDIX hydrolase n=1 Tax=Actinospica robiniae TaxID=304901 RepID=UPI0003FDB052|nr:NUDIX hydrolase [Actinospica robiniae]